MISRVFKQCLAAPFEGYVIMLFVVLTVKPNYSTMDNINTRKISQFIQKQRI